MLRRTSRRSAALPVLSILPLLGLCAGTARADVALLRNGRSLTVSDYRLQGDRILLVMEGGGQIALPNDQVVAIRRDQAVPPGAIFDREALRDLAARVARKHRVDEALVLAVIEVESRYDAFAVSPRGAMGLMQLMPETAARFAVRNAFNPVENVDGGVRYLKELLERYSGQVRLALAAYNAGEEAVDQFRGIPPFRETQQYVVRVLKALPR